jgi:DNA-binding MarR family transcriptional regulator
MSTIGMPDAVAKRLGYALKRAQHALRVSMDEVLRPLGLTTPQYAVLCAIEADPGISNASLARAAFVTAQTMRRELRPRSLNALST